MSTLPTPASNSASDTASNTASDTTSDATQTANSSWIKRHPVITMVVLMFAIAWPLLFAEAADSYGLTNIQLPQWLGIFTGWAPGIAAFLVTAMVNGRKGVRELLRKTFRWRVGAHWYVIALFGIAIVILAGVALYGLITGDWVALPISQASPVEGIVSVIALIALGVLINTEEMAWRGFMQARLQRRYTALAACLLVALPETLLHLPYFFTKDSFFQQQGPIAFTCFTIALAILYGWLFNNARGSVFICTIAHAAQNTWSNLIAPEGLLLPFYLVVGLLCVIAIILVLVNGPARLSRHPIDEASVY